MRAESEPTAAVTGPTAALARRRYAAESVGGAEAPAPAGGCSSCVHGGQAAEAVGPTADDGDMPSFVPAPGHVLTAAALWTSL